jgi:hypothetical protein
VHSAEGTRPQRTGSEASLRPRGPQGCTRACRAGGLWKDLWETDFPEAEAMAGHEEQKHSLILSDGCRDTDLPWVTFTEHLLCAFYHIIFSLKCQYL